ncbi:MAG: RpiB/LacA/LacB family sugar-phosphate isomerase [Candidatus Magasanikbacteria bacterium]|nr:RpiB/LacA/LacB family sugar-phosphate isomerase [Candidatus Magasanikbacteria bacterium]
MLYIAADHAGHKLKKYLATYITKTLQQKVEDLGAKTYKEDDDFPDYAVALAKKVVSNKKNWGILLCGSGQGMCITANKVPGIRAGLGYSIEAAERGRKEDDMNVLCLASRVLSTEHAAAIVKAFLENNFDGLGRRVRRLKKIAALEK